MEVKVKSPAKINLTLDVVAKRADGYHDISTVMQAVSLYDTVTLSDSDSGDITVSCNYPGVPCDEKNICYKAARIFFDYTKKENNGLNIDIEKKIPAQAGLAGGSSNAAAALLGLNRLYGASLTPAELKALGEKLGADVPFCLVGGTKYASGKGTELKKVPPLSRCKIVICKPDKIGVSTAEAYKKADGLNPHPLFTDEMIKALYSRDMFRITSTIYNDFEAALKIPEVNEIKNIMYKSKAAGAGMSGSGSAAFGIFTSNGKAEKCAERLREKYSEVFVCEPIKDGCRIE